MCKEENSQAGISEKDLSEKELSKGALSEEYILELQDKIIINDLKISCIIGILPKERECKQDLIVSLCVGIPNIKKAALSADIKDCINYFDLAQETKKYVEKRQAFLLEELAQEICDLIFLKYNVAFIKLKLIKPAAIEDAAGAGIEIFRKRPLCH